MNERLAELNSKFQNKVRGGFFSDEKELEAYYSAIDSLFELCDIAEIDIDTIAFIEQSTVYADYKLFVCFYNSYHPATDKLKAVVSLAGGKIRGHSFSGRMWIDL